MSPALMAAAILALVVGGLTAWWIKGSVGSDLQGPEGVLWPPARQMTAFSLLDQHGAPYTDEKLRGHWTLVFFGFTNCPDLCPNTMRLLRDAMKQIDARPQVVFVSVDPGRDTAEIIKAYLDYFDPEFTGLTGREAEIEKLSRNLGALATRTAPDESGAYSVDHSASIFVLDPQARLVGLLSQPLTAESIASGYRNIRKFVEKRS